MNTAITTAYVNTTQADCRHSDERHHSQVDRWLQLLHLFGSGVTRLDCGIIFGVVDVWLGDGCWRAFVAVHLVSAKSKPIRAMSARKKEGPKADEINLALPLPSHIGVGKSTRKDQNQQASEKGVRDATELRASSITGSRRHWATSFIQQAIGRSLRSCQELSTRRSKTREFFDCVVNNACVKFGKLPHGRENFPSNVAQLANFACCVMLRACRHSAKWQDRARQASSMFGGLVTSRSTLHARFRTGWRTPVPRFVTVVLAWRSL